MERQRWTSGWRRLLAPAVGVVAMLTGMLPANAEARPQALTGWIRDNAAPLDTVDPTAPLGDLVPLRRSIGDVEIVGLGESTHGAAEELTLKHRLLRLLVERMGFRSIAWEEDWTTGLRINEYLQTGRGDLHALLRQMSPQWQERQVADVLAWLRDYNAGHADKVRFVGVEYYLLRAMAYDAVEHYVADAAPGRLPELRRHLRVIRPTTSDMFAYVGWYLGVADKAPYLRHARRAYRLVKGIPHRPGDRSHALALHHALRPDADLSITGLVLVACEAFGNFPPGAPGRRLGTGQGAWRPGPARAARPLGARPPGRPGLDRQGSDPRRPPYRLVHPLTHSAAVRRDLGR